MFSLTTLNTFSFAAFGHMNNVVLPKYVNSKHIEFVSGALVGASLGVFSTPFEMIKVQMQLDNIREKNYKGSFHCAKYLIHHHGLLSLWTGYRVNTVRETIFASIYFGVYSHSKRFWTSVNNNSIWAVPLSGGCAGMAAWFCSFPLDVIKSTIQDRDFKTKFQRGTISIGYTVWKTVGIRGFYRGIAPSMIRSFFVSGSRFSAYEFAYETLTWMENYKKLS